MKEAIYHFPVEGNPVSCSQMKAGHINETFLITTDTGVKYVLQWINQYVFPNVQALMGNVSKISSFLREQPDSEIKMIAYIDTVEGNTYYDDGKGGAWRVYRFVENSICHQQVESAKDFYESARGFGGFQYALREFPAETLEETIVNFHNTVDRYAQLKSSIDADACGRLAEVSKEVEFALSCEEKACELHRMRERGELPIRVTHNDTKINNVLLDDKTGKAICVIDLDTVMPGLSAFDYGDAIRFGATKAAEDERDLSIVTVDLDLFRAFTRGFIEACPSLTPAEIEAMPLGAFAMTVECGIRFLKDYIDGDKYFSIEREKQNLDRARTQFKLASDMEKHWDEMVRIVREEAAK